MSIGVFNPTPIFPVPLVPREGNRRGLGIRRVARQEFIAALKAWETERRAIAEPEMDGAQSSVVFESGGHVFGCVQVYRQYREGEDQRAFLRLGDWVVWFDGERRFEVFTDEELRKRWHVGTQPSTGNAAADQILATAPAAGHDGVALVVKSCMALLRGSAGREASAVAAMRVAIGELDAALELSPGEGFVPRIERAAEFLRECLKDLTD